MTEHLQKLSEISFLYNISSFDENSTWVDVSNTYQTIPSNICS